ncbi:MAG: DUF4405 domain-containing protein [Raoultibacter sp.]
MKKNLIIDATALVIYLLVSNPALTGISIHEWISLGLLVVVFIHTLMHFDWIVDTLTHLKTNHSGARLGNFALDAATLIVFVVVMVSGMGISGAVLAACGLYAPGYYFWNPLHAIAAKVLLALLLVHLVVHWKWFAEALRRKTKEEQHKSLPTTKEAKDEQADTLAGKSGTL